MNALTRILTTAVRGASSVRTVVPSARLGAVLSWLRDGFHTVSRLGTQGYSPDVARRLAVMNVIAYMIGITTFGYALQNLALDYNKYQPVILLNLVLACTAFAVPLSHRYGELCGGLIIIVSEFLALVTFTYYLGRDSGIHLQYFIAASAAIVVFGIRRWWITIPSVVIGIGLHMVSWFYFPPGTAVIDAPPEVLNSFYFQAAMSTGVLTAAAVSYAFLLVEQAKAETAALLRNILPDSVVERLKSDSNEVVADSFEDASILFSDIKGFVSLARSLGAEKTVELLNNIVMRFDGLAAVHGVEKIKTIGDAYMVAAGIPEAQEDHTQRLARMGLSMLRVVEEVREETGVDLQMRVGLASGPVMAGVIGTRKFSYDVWGDPVNLAARLENKSSPGKILTCPGCYEKLRDSFDLEPHGKIEIKGVGLQEAWFVVSERRAQKPKTKSGGGRRKKGRGRSKRSARP